MVLPVGLCLLLSVVLQNLSQMNKHSVPEKQIIEYHVTRKTETVREEVIIKRDSGFFGSACFSRVYVDSTEVAGAEYSSERSLYTNDWWSCLQRVAKKEYGGGMAEQAGKVDRTDLSHRVWIKRW